jgi:hypothetical protein
VISASISTRPLTCKRTAVEAETEKITQPAGRGADTGRISMLETPFPERDLMDWCWEVAVVWAVLSVVAMNTT